MKPKRIQRKRAKGWRMPENTVIVTRPGMFGNPYLNISAFKVWIDTGYVCHLLLINNWATKEMMDNQRNLILSNLPELKGKNLACWCPLDKPCHADILLELANK